MRRDNSGHESEGRYQGVNLLELVRLLLQYKWGIIFRQEWFWRMEEITKRNGKGMWL